MGYETVAPENKYLYNGKEFSEDYGIKLMDYEARWYDGAIGRFTTVDPLAEKYPEMTPYNYVGNNPINSIDIRGDTITPIITSKGGKDGRDLLTINITGKLLNRSENDVNMESALSRIKSLMESSFQGENINGYDMNLNFDFTVAKSGKEVSPSDHLIILAEPKDWNKKIPGASDWNPNSRVAGYNAIIDADYFTGFYDRFLGQEGPRTAAHEMGHLLGLGHLNSDSRNLMAQGQSYKRGNAINSSQLLGIQASLMSPTMFTARLNDGDNRGHGMAIYPFRFVKE